MGSRVLGKCRRPINENDGEHVFRPTNHIWNMEDEKFTLAPLLTLIEKKSMNLMYQIMDIKFEANDR